MWLLSYFKRSVGNCHSALRRGIQYKKHNKKNLAEVTGFRVGARNDSYQPTI